MQAVQSSDTDKSWGGRERGQKMEERWLREGKGKRGKGGQGGREGGKEGREVGTGDIQQGHVCLCKASSSPVPSLELCQEQ